MQTPLLTCLKRPPRGGRCFLAAVLDQATDHLLFAFDCFPHVGRGLTWGKKTRGSPKIENLFFFPLPGPKPVFWTPHQELESKHIGCEVGKTVSGRKFIAWEAIQGPDELYPFIGGAILVEKHVFLILRDTPQHEAKAEPG